ncbi:hypothetical protein RND71_012807 [Anisodus tanguticus]|uniref:Bulb-type lectin domain-containing protein n=1 Tax=Anisodus tanguticus TaxID=243964 RepID=A0AAE1SFD5_9SOLA|nr:hypothetical protein RND71_012807 [Anisodus tanguticus]
MGKIDSEADVTEGSAKLADAIGDDSDAVICATGFVEIVGTLEVGRVHTVQPACSNAASTESMMSCKTELPTLCFASKHSPPCPESSTPSTNRSNAVLDHKEMKKTCQSDGPNHMINEPQIVWSANRNRLVRTNATLQLGRDGKLVLEDSDGSLVWSTNTTGKSVSGLNLTEMGNLVLFDKTNHAIWQSFNHPTDSLLPGQTLVFGWKLMASISVSNWSQGLLSLTILNGNLVAYTDTNPPQYYYASDYSYSTFRFDSQTHTALQYPPTSTPQFMKLGPDGHLRVYKWEETYWKEVSDILIHTKETAGTQWCVEDTTFVRVTGNVVVQLKETSSGHLSVGKQILDVRS